MPRGRGEQVFGVQFGVQFEPNSEQLRSNRPNEDGRDQLIETPTLRLGAGRSQVQILSPRLQGGSPREPHEVQNPSLPTAMAGDTAIGLAIGGDSDRALPHVLNITFPGVDGEAERP